MSLPGLFKITSGYKPTAEIETFLGDQGELFYSSDLRVIVISDGVTPGGNLLNSLRVQNYTAGTVDNSVFTGTLAFDTDNFALEVLPSGTIKISVIGIDNDGVGSGSNINILGSFNNVNQLPQTATIGDSYLIASELHVWKGSEWENVGPIRGPQGYTGSRGFVGSRGDTGFTGSQGDLGYTGSIGYTGSQGLIGYTGSKGDTGFVGSRGDIGYTGSQGDIGYTGSQGDTGFVGSRGDVGFAGSQGDIGYTGSKGDTGFVGSKGFTGSQGDTGYTGSVGFTGSQGVMGYTGSIGDIGYTGSTGYTGSYGEIGYTGSKGDIGFVGSQGFTGSNGFVGSQGYTGSQGDVGFTGSKGDTGADGKSVSIIGSVANTSAGSAQDIINSAFPNAQISNGVIDQASGNLWVYDGELWNNVGRILGYTGSRGIQGYTGSRGDVGYTGSQGDIGFTGSLGDTGFTGSVGFVGSRGEIGYTGSLGDTGFTGSVGYTGSTGYTGSYGEIGYTGSKGDTGFVGSQGIPGNTGFVGSKGDAGSGATVTVGTIDSDNNIGEITVLNVEAIRFDTDSGFDVTDLGSGSVKIGMNSTFKTIKVDGEEDLIAIGLDTLEIVAGNNIVLTTDTSSNPKALVISSTASGTGASFGNLDGGEPDSNYGGITSIDAGGVV